MPAPSAPMPFMSSSSDLSRLMANTSYLESMPSTLAEVEAASRWRARNVPAADMALAGDAAAPLASTRHEHNSNTPWDDYDPEYTNSMLQQAFYSPSSSASSSAAAKPSYVIIRRHHHWLYICFSDGCYAE